MSGTKNLPLGGVLDGEKHEPLPRRGTLPLSLMLALWVIGPT